MPSSPPAARGFDHEELDVYAASLDLVALAHEVISGFPRDRASLADPLERASTSIALVHRHEKA